ncbi:ADP-ribosylation factor GTPase-activating protein [Salix suchowensis]|nr:ADP-ribosylation factor GTPase-activating protein [Salix suchowensis]
MGKREFGYLYMHAVLRDPQKSWGTHIKGSICNPRHMASRTGCIYSMYEEKRWVSKDGRTHLLLVGWMKDLLCIRDLMKEVGMDAPEVLKICLRKKRIHKYQAQGTVTPARPQQVVEKAEPMVEVTESAKKVADAAPAVSAPKVDFATDLFNLLSMDGPSENGSAAASNEDNGWAGVQFSEKPQKDVKNDIMSLFEKSNMVSPFAMHQQQLAMLAQQQQLVMAAAAKSAGGNPKVMNQQQLAMLIQQQQLLAAAAKPVARAKWYKHTCTNWPNMGYQIPGLMMPVAGQGDLQKLMQTGNIGMTHPGGSAVQYPASSFYDMGQATLPMV